MDKYTRGPWKAVGAFVITKDEKIDICSTCNVNNLPVREQIANARLIAAAPDLLNALKYYRDEYTGAEPSISVFERLAKEAITKAERRLK